MFDIDSIQMASFALVRYITHGFKSIAQLSAGRMVQQIAYCDATNFGINSRCISKRAVGVYLLPTSMQLPETHYITAGSACGRVTSQTIIQTWTHLFTPEKKRSKQARKTAAGVRLTHRLKC